MATSAWDLGKQASMERQQQRNQIQEQQRVQQQNTIGAQLLDAINNASNIKPQTKDENGNIIHNPEYDNAQDAKQKLLSQYTTLMSPAQHANFAQHLHGLIFGHADHRPQQPALSPNSSPNEPPAPVAQGQAPASSSAAPAPLHPGAALTQPAPADHPIHAITKGIKALGDHLSAFANPTPAAPPPDPSLIAKYYKDPGEVAHERQMEMWGLRGQTAENVAKLRGLAIRGIPYNKAAVTLDSAMSRAHDMGEQFINVSTGEPFDLAAAKEAMPGGKLVPVFQGNHIAGWSLADQTDRLLGWDNQQHVVGEFTIDPKNSEIAGLRTVPREATHQVPGMNPGEVVTLHSTSTPVTPEPQASPTPQAAPLQNPQAVPPSPAGEPANPTLKVRPQPTAAPTLPPSPSQAALTAKANAGRSQSRQIPQPSGAPMPPPFAKGTMLSQGRNAQPVVAAMNTVAAQVFGGNGEKPIWENAWMFDKPELRAALNKALTLNALAIPGTEDDPSFTQTLATAVGATGWSQDQIRQANQEARDNLQRLGGDDALAMFARMAGLQEDLSALRTATKASAAQGSIRTLVRAAPVYNVSSSRNFRDQLGVTLNTAESAMRGYPAINPAYLDWFKRGASAARGGPTSTNAPKIHEFAIDDQGRKHPVLDPNAKLPQGWKWAQ